MFPFLLFVAFAISIYDSVQVIISYVALSFVTFFLLMLATMKRFYSMALGSVFIFYILFFLTAPLIQYNSNSIIMINTMPYSSNKVALANYLLAIFLFFLFFSHSYFSKFFKSNGIREFGSVDVSVFFIVTILFLLSLYVVFMWDFLYLYALTKYGKVNDYELNFIDSLVTFKLVGLVPLAALATFSLRNAGIK